MPTAVAANNFAMASFNLSKMKHKGEMILAQALPEKASQSQEKPGLEVVCGDWKVTVMVIVFLSFYGTLRCC